MLQIKNTNGGYGDETAIRAENIAITQTLGRLSTLSFVFIADEMNAVGADMIVPRTIITEPVTKQQFRIITSNPQHNSKYRIIAVTANHVGGDLHDKYSEKQLTKTQSLKTCMNLVTENTKFNYIIHDNFSNYAFSEGFGTGFADELLQQLASDFGFEYYFDNYTIHILKSVGKSDAFLFLDGANVSKITVNEDYTGITTHIRGYAGKPDEKTGVYPISAEYTSPLANNNHWGKIDAEIYTNENMTQQGLQAKLKTLVHDYPDVQYSLGYVNFKKNLTGFKNDSSVGNYGWLRDRFGIDTQVRVQSRTFYPQDTKNNGAITFGNTIYDPIMLQNQIRKGWKDNIKLGGKIKEQIGFTNQQINNISNDFDQTNNHIYPWKGKSITVIGDSITYGYIDKQNGQDITAPWTLQLKPICKFGEITNNGVGSSRIATSADEPSLSFCERVNNYTSQDFIVMFGGVNDFASDIPMGNFLDETTETFFGALEYMAKQLIQKNQHARILWCTPVINTNLNHHTYDNKGELVVNNVGCTELDYANAIKKVAGYYGFPILDLFSNCIVNPLSRPEMFRDGTHPNKQGYVLLGQQISRYINTL